MKLDTNLNYVTQADGSAFYTQSKIEKIFKRLIVNFNTVYVFVLTI